jgi:hypothetical protein
MDGDDHFSWFSDGMVSLAFFVIRLFWYKVRSLVHVYVVNGGTGGPFLEVFRGVEFCGTDVGAVFHVFFSRYDLAGVELFIGR